MPYFSFLPGITRNGLSRPATRLYPAEKREPYPNTRGSIVIDGPKCTFCTLCQKKCPTAAITVRRKEKVWSIDRLRCIQCGACVDPCPKKCLTLSSRYSPPSAGPQVFAYQGEMVASASPEAKI